MASIDEVLWLIRCLFGREPSYDELRAHVAYHANSSFDECRRAFYMSDEGQLNQRLVSVTRPVAYHPETKRNERRPKLALAIIVKDGARTIENTILSCIPVVSHVSIFDTGSTDDTVAIANDLLGKSSISYDIKSGNFVDFSHARNFAISMVPQEMDWILMLDADEYLVEEDHERLSALILQKNVEVWQLPRYNFSTESLSETISYPDYQRRLFRNLPHIKYFGAVHETIIGVAHWGFAPPNLSAQGGDRGGPHIHHTGCLRSARTAEEKHILYSTLAAL